MIPAEQTEYIVQCVRDAGSMYETDARAFLAEHDSHVRTAARNEAADWLASYPLGADTTDWARGRGDAIAWVCGILRNPDPHKPEPGEHAAFFQVGRTYARGFTTSAPLREMWSFKVTAVADGPDGLTTALGFLHGATCGSGVWTPHGEYEFDGWTDVTEAGTR